MINLAGVDCFTFLDYVEAMRRSISFAAFKENLRQVRYQGGVVDYKHRNHFFADWVVFNAGFIDDVTVQIGAGKSKKTVKILNGAEKGQPLLPGIAVRKREVSYIPSELIDRYDFIPVKNRGLPWRIYRSGKPGCIACRHCHKKRARIFFRHASSQKKYRKVVDEDLKAYLLT